MTARKVVKVSRQRRWQLNKIAAGLCETCGEPRGDERANMRHCENCAAKRGDREQLRRENEAKARAKARRKRARTIKSRG